ncbi:MAG: aminotransferase class I/II-fold pyridoxal phosphate-dependent enzyme [Romboutsia sp.]|uniref:aminotransferase class I/II-fold pyridoxal phosphate-dependent enzyme n=1 Tax=Romboutsia sp. TaxID=1965302 RepID=UPI003F3D95A5
MKNYILDKLEEIRDEEIISFHVPGHKSGRIFETLGYKDKLEKIYKIDTTEIEGTDNLHNAKEVIKQSQERASKLFNSQKTIYLVNGSTCGIQAAIMSVCPPKSKIITNRDCHQSVINACILGDIAPSYIEAEICKNTNILNGVSVSKAKETIDSNLDAKAIILTYPTYYGMTYELQEIINYAHSKEMILIVDEAHGAHLELSDELPKSALALGADLVIQSTHKTLPAFTQSSMIHINSHRVDYNKLLSVLRMIESSSPSYLLLSSLELAMDIYEKHGERLMTELLNRIEILKNKFEEDENVLILNEMDKTKIFISFKDYGITGYELDEILRGKYNIQVELSNFYGVLLICTIGNNDGDFISLETALQDILLNCNTEKILESIDYPTNIPIKVFDPRDAFYKDKKKIKIENSIGKICGEYIIPYPPGISLISPGEIITQEIIAYIQDGVKNGMIVSGLEDSNLEFINIIEK